MPIGNSKGVWIRLFFTLFCAGVWCLPTPASPAQEARPKPAPASRSQGAAGLRARLQPILAGPQARRADWGILVADEASGETLYALHADRFFTPASNAKLFTVALALADLGPDFRWRTTLETGGQVGPDGTLAGDLVFVGRGDPNLSNRVFPFGDRVEVEGPPEKAIADLVDQLAARGVKRITGDVVADDTYFTYDRYPPGWEIDDLTAEYGAPVSAIVLDDNNLEIDVTPGTRIGARASLAALPWSAFYQLRDHVLTVRRGRDPELSVSHQPDSFDVTVTGQLPVGSPTQQLYLPIEQPARYVAALLRHLLSQRGITVGGGIRTEHLLPDATPPPPAARQVLAQRESPTLAEAARYLMKVSQNLHAECLLRTVAHERTGVGSLENGLAVEREFLARLGLADQVRLYDGSGLSRYDLVTPRAVVTLLRYAARQSWSPVFLDALPVAGRDGTLAHRMQGTPAAGRVFAKTGTLVHDNSLSGYATTLGGRRVVFSLLVNNTPPRAKFDPLLDRVAEAIVEDAGRAPRRAPAPRRRR